MSNDQRAIDSVAAVFCLVLAVVVFRQTAGLPVPRWEPIGPAALPRAVSVIIAILSLAMLGSVFFQKQKGSGTVKANSRLLHQWRSLLVLIIFVVLLSLMQAGLINFIAFSTLQIFSAYAILGRINLKNIAIYTAVSVTFAFSIHYIFTRILVTALP